MFPLTTFCLILAAAEPAIPPPTGDRIVAANARLELLFMRTAPIKGGLTEGPACAPDGSIYFSDIPMGPDKGMILRFDPKSSRTSVFTDDSGKSNGLKFDPQGQLMACEGADGGGRRIVRWNVHTKERVMVADRFQGRRFNAPNDLCIDARGRIYFSDPKYVGDEKRELEHRAVYRIDRDGRVVEVTHDVEKPNGIALSPDQKTLYVADHNNGTDQIGATDKAPQKGAMKIHAFPLGQDGLINGARKTLVDFGTENGCDGMTVDAHGHVYLTARSLKRPGVLVIDPAGKEVAFIPTGPPLQTESTPVGLPSNICFGRGDDLKTLYITIDTSLYRIRLNVEGHHLPLAR